MQEPTTKQPVADPADYSVEMPRNHTGELSLIAMWRDRPTPRSLFALYAIGDEIDDLLRAAREIAGSDPHDDRLPPDRAIIEAALLDAGFALKDEDEPQRQQPDHPLDGRGQMPAAWAAPGDDEATLAAREHALDAADYRRQQEAEQPGAQDDAEDAFFSIGREATTSVRSLAARLGCYPATAQAILAAGYWPDDEIDALVLWSFTDHSGYAIAEFPFKNLGAEPEDLPRLRPLFLRLCSNARADARTEFEQAGMRMIQEGLRALLGAGSAADVAAVTESVKRLAGRN